MYSLLKASIFLSLYVYVTSWFLLALVLFLLQTKTSFGNMKVGVVPYVCNVLFFWKKKKMIIPWPIQQVVPPTQIHWETLLWVHPFSFRVIVVFGVGMGRFILWRHTMLQGTWMQVSSIESCFDRRSFQSIKVDSIKDESQFSQSLLKLLLSLAVDKRMKNNQALSLGFYHHFSIETFASIELTFGFDRMNSWSKQPAIELTRYRVHVHVVLDAVNSTWLLICLFVQRMRTVSSLTCMVDMIGSYLELLKG